MKLRRMLNMLFLLPVLPMLGAAGGAGEAAAGGGAGSPETGGEGENGKEAAAKEPPQDETRAAEAEEKLRLANERLLSGTVRGMAAELGLTERGAKAAAKLADLSGCFTQNGDLDEAAVKDALEDFLAEYPEFSRKKEPETGFRVGGTGGRDATGTGELISEIFGNTK